MNKKRKILTISLSSSLIGVGIASTLILSSCKDNSMTDSNIPDQPIAPDDSNSIKKKTLLSLSYTHMTLPTNREV